MTALFVVGLVVVAAAVVFLGLWMHGDDPHDPTLGSAQLRRPPVRPVENQNGLPPAGVTVVTTDDEAEEAILLQRVERADAVFRILRSGFVPDELDFPEEP